MILFVSFQCEVYGLRPPTPTADDSSANTHEQLLRALHVMNLDPEMFREEEEKSDEEMGEYITESLAVSLANLTLLSNVSTYLLHQHLREVNNDRGSSEKPIESGTEEKDENRDTARIDKETADAERNPNLAEFEREGGSDTKTESAWEEQSEHVRNEIIERSIACDEIDRTSIVTNTQRREIYELSRDDRNTYSHLTRRARKLTL